MNQEDINKAQSSLELEQEQGSGDFFSQTEPHNIENNFKPAEISENAKVVLEHRYLLKNDSGEVAEDPDGLFRRVASALAKPDKSYGASTEEIKETSEEFYQMLSSLEFLANSPTLMNAGTKAGTSVPLNLDAAAGSDSTVNLTEGSGITLTQTSATEITIASAAGDTYDLNATADGSNVDLNLTSGSGTDNSTVQFTAGTGMTLTRTGAQEVTFASAAGVTMTTSPAATGNGSTATYPLGATPTDENFTMAYISGVYQLKSSYTVSGSNITFDTNVPNGASIEIVTTT